MILWLGLAGSAEMVWERRKAQHRDICLIFLRYFRVETVFSYLLVSTPPSTGLSHKVEQVLRCLVQLKWCREWGRSCGDCGSEENFSIVLLRA